MQTKHQIPGPLDGYRYEQQQAIVARVNEINDKTRPCPQCDETGTMRTHLTESGKMYCTVCGGAGRLINR